MRYRLFVIWTLLVLTGCQAPVLSATTSAAVTPVPQTTALAAWPFDGFKMVDDRSGWAWKGISQLYRTDDGGANWTEIHLQGRMLTAGAFYMDRNEAWLPGVADGDLSQSVFHTVDGGKNWKELGRLHGPNLALYFHDPKQGWATNGIAAAGNIFYQVYQTLDGGQSWGQLQPTVRADDGQMPMPDTIHVASGDSVSFTPPDTIWITSGHGDTTMYAGLTVSQDGGATWQDVNPPLPADDLRDRPPVTVAAPQFVTDQDAYLRLTVGPRLLFFVSHDAGNTWTLMPLALPAGQMTPRVQFLSTQDGFAVCGRNLCSTQNGGQSWQAIPSQFRFDPAGGGTYVSQFDFVDAQTGWGILSDQDGRTSLMKTSDGGRTWTEVEVRLGL